MNFQEFEAKAIALLANQRPDTLLLVGGGGMYLAERELCASPRLDDGTFEPLEDGCNVDVSAWNDEINAFDGMTTEEIEAALARPRYFTVDGTEVTGD